MKIKNCYYTGFCFEDYIYILNLNYHLCFISTLVESIIVGKSNLNTKLLNSGKSG